MKTKCDHIVGWWDGCDEAGFVSVSDWNMHVRDMERWKFCPLCGKDTSKLKEPKPYQSNVTHDPLTQSFIKESERLGAKMIAWYAKKHNSLTSFLDGGTFEREVKHD
jgi:hypothetical protein